MTIYTHLTFNSEINVMFKIDIFVKMSKYTVIFPKYSNLIFNIFCPIDK